MLIAGTADPVTTVVDAEFMQKAINNSQLAKLEALIFLILRNRKDYSGID